MKRTWILMANATKAACFERSNEARGLKRLAEFEDPLGRAKGRDLMGDRSGYESTGHGGSGTAFVPRNDAKTNQHEGFARRLAQHLNEGIAAHRCEQLAIVASNPFLGELKSHLDAQATKALTKAVAKDLAAFSGDELVRRIEDALHLPR